MNIKKISTTFNVRKLTVSDCENILKLFHTNPEYNKHCPPIATKECIIEDMLALPPNKTLEDKFYIGYFENEKLVAILDLILGYPQDDTAFLGLFMLHKDYQGKGIGKAIITELSDFLKINNFNNIRLAYAKTNENAKNFWLKNNFELLNIEKDNVDYIAVLMEKSL